MIDHQITANHPNHPFSLLHGSGLLGLLGLLWLLLGGTSWEGQALVESLRDDITRRSILQAIPGTVQSIEHTTCDVGDELAKVGRLTDVARLCGVLGVGHC